MIEKQFKDHEIKGAYWIIQWFLVHYQTLNFFNIAIAILDFSQASYEAIALPTIATALKGDSEDER